MTILAVVLWASLALLVWTHVGYPLLAAVVARLFPRPVHAGDGLPTVALVIAAYNEEDVIEAKLENALALDYPRERLRIIVASDASSDRTDEIVRGFADRGVELSVCPRGGKVNAQNVTVRGLDSDILAFSDANCELGSGRAHPPRPRVRRPGGRLRLRPAAPAQPRGHEPGGAVLALRAMAARSRVEDRTR